MNPHHDVSRAVELAARDSYGRLIAFLVARCRDLASAEDALADALQAALQTWPQNGIPDKPEAWLLTVARRRLIDSARHARLHNDIALTLLAISDDAQERVSSSNLFPDERLKLLFVCAHPAINAAARTPLMLQAVLGLDAARIASAFLVQPATMSQRLTRAKTKIRDAGISFELPEAKELPTRLETVLEAIYAAYGSGWEDIAGTDPKRKGLATEAVDLGRLLLHLLPNEPEVLGLVALMLYCESRRDARRSPAGSYVPLAEQDVAQWSGTMISEANQLLATAEQMGQIGHFQLEAAIQAVHVRRAWTGHTDWKAIALLYEGLVRIAPTIGAQVSCAAAIAEEYGAAAGWRRLTNIPGETVKSYQPYWALAAKLLVALGCNDEAAEAYSLAIGLCADPAMREFLQKRLLEASGDTPS